MFSSWVGGGSSSDHVSLYTDPPLVCKVTLFGIEYESNLMLRAGASTSSRDFFYACNPVQDDGRISPHLYDLALSDEFWESHRSQLLRGEDLYVSIPGGIISPNDETVIIPDPTLVQVFAGDPPLGHIRRLARPATEGTLTLLVLRIEATDAEPTVSADELYDYTFESDVSLKSQLRLCSWNQLRIEPTTWGVLNVPVNLPVAGTNYRTLVNAGYTAAMEQLGGSTSQGDASTDVRSLADLVMLVLPPGTGSWKGFASVGGQQSVFNNEWSSYVGATAHEIGHNLGLHHAFQDGIEYGDVTGYMGGAVKQTNYPQRCYNAHNHWHLGWYESRALEVTPSSDPVLYSVVPFVDYDKASDGEYVVIQLSGLDLYLQYNRQKSFNIATGEFPDKLVVVQDFGEGTNLLAGLDLDVPWYQHNVDGSVLTIEVCSVQLSSSSDDPDFVEVSIGYGGSLCANSTAPASSVAFSSQSRSIDQVLLPVATVSALVVVTLALTALFLRAAMPLRKRQPGPSKFQAVPVAAAEHPPQRRPGNMTTPKPVAQSPNQDWDVLEGSASNSSLAPACGCLDWSPFWGERGVSTSKTGAAVPALVTSPRGGRRHR